MTANMSELEAAIAAGLQVAVNYAVGTVWVDMVNDATDALDSYCEQVAALQADNARLREFVQSVVSESHERQIEITLHPFGHENTVALMHYAMSLDKLGEQAAAALADVEATSTTDAMKDGEQ